MEAAEWCGVEVVDEVTAAFGYIHSCAPWAGAAIPVVAHAAADCCSECGGVGGALDESGCVGAAVRRRVGSLLCYLVVRSGEAVPSFREVVEAFATWFSNAEVVVVPVGD